MLPGVKDSVLAKTVKVTEARLARSGSRVTAERRTEHEEGAVAEALTALARDNDMVVMFGASAMSDPDDVIPAAIRLAGGEVIRAGMPVDPGNLIVVGRYRGKPVLGAPGCARSPKENGFDWVLDRLIAGIDVTDADVAGLGVGGLLMEIPTRPQPRESVREMPLAARRRDRAGGRPLEPHGRPQQADGAVRRPAAGAAHRRDGARQPGRGGRGGDRPSGRARGGSACRARRQACAQRRLSSRGLPAR